MNLSRAARVASLTLGARIAGLSAGELLSYGWEAAHHATDHKAQRAWWAMLSEVKRQAKQRRRAALVPDLSYTIDTKTTPADTVAMAREAVDSMTGRGRYIVTQHYLEGRDLQDVAAELGVSAGRVSQLKARAFEEARTGRRWVSRQGQRGTA